MLVETLYYQTYDLSLIPSSITHEFFFFFHCLQFQYAPQHLVRLLQIIVDGNCDMAVRQFASIHFKNFVAKSWSPHEPGMSTLSDKVFSF